MLDRTVVRRPEELFTPMSGRTPSGVCFARICGWNEQARDCVWRFHEAARQRGIVVEGSLQNPDGPQIGYMNDALGSDFRDDEAFISEALKRWLPALEAQGRGDLAHLMCARFEMMRGQGKSESVLKNLYTKLMCWLYYRFSRIIPLLGENEPPRILFICGVISAHELVLLQILNRLGADILLVLTSGEASYLKRDPGSELSQLLFPDAAPFPAGWSLKTLRREMTEQPWLQETSTPRLSVRKVDPLSYFPRPSREICTNAWMKEADYAQILTPEVNRGDDPGLYYNAFIRVCGVKDKLMFPEELHRFYQRLSNTGRSIVIVNEGLTTPGPEEVAQIRRRNYRTAEEMIVDLANNLPKCADADLEHMLQRAFVTTVLEAQSPEEALNRLLASTVYLLCWIRRWHRDLFQDHRAGGIPCFILMQGCRNRQEALYPRFLSRLPVDVLILAPDLNHPCALEDAHLLELRGGESLRMSRFPIDAGSMQMRTVAAHAEEELGDLLYRDSGLYRNMQFEHAEAMTLRTTLDEMFMLWDEELRFRPGFATEDRVVTMPVLYARISGVERGEIPTYWQRIRQLAENDAFFCKSFPVIRHDSMNPFQSLALRSLRGGALSKSVLRADRQYPFGNIREEIQDHILDKIQLMLDRRLIRGTFENGTEYTVVATLLNMDKKLVRMLQSFDFTRRNPKAVFVAADDRAPTLEDAILLTFLNLVGFDVALFVPTGYRTIERHLNDDLPVEHQAGEYMYELKVPELKDMPKPRKRSWLDNLLKRGNGYGN